MRVSPNRNGSPFPGRLTLIRTETTSCTKSQSLRLRAGKHDVGLTCASLLAQEDLDGQVVAHVRARAHARAYAGALAASREAFQARSQDAEQNLRPAERTPVHSENDTAQVKKVCRSPRRCISSVQTLARVRAVSREPVAWIVCNLAEKPVKAPGETLAIKCSRHETCSAVSSDTKTQKDSASPSEEKKRGTTPCIVPSRARRFPEFRDSIRFEWIFSQPSRRDSQCVPT